MDPHRLRHLQALLEHYGREWDWDTRPCLTTPAELPGISARPQDGDSLSAPVVRFRKETGLVVVNDILKPVPGRWIAAEGHVISAQVNDGTGWLTIPWLAGRLVK